MLEADRHKSWTEGQPLNLGVGRGRSQAVDLEYGVIGGEAGMNYALVQFSQLIIQISYCLTSLSIKIFHFSWCIQHTYRFFLIDLHSC